MTQHSGRSGSAIAHGKAFEGGNTTSTLLEQKSGYAHRKHEMRLVGIAALCRRKCASLKMAMDYHGTSNLMQDSASRFIPVTKVRRLAGLLGARPPWYLSGLGRSLTFE